MQKKATRKIPGDLRNTRFESNFSEIKAEPQLEAEIYQGETEPPPKIGIQIAGQLTLQFSIERDRHDIEIVGSRATRTTGPILIIFNVADFRKQTAIPASGIPS